LVYTGDSNGFGYGEHSDIHNEEVVVNEPSIVALDRNNLKTVLAVGKRALMMHEKTHESIRTIRPLKDGVIADLMRRS
jgi:rod shape-determining protein MreB